MGKVSFFEKYVSASFFGKLTNDCMLVIDVKKMADEYEANEDKIIDSYESKIKDLSDSNKEIVKKNILDIEGLKKYVTELENKIEDKDKIISDLRTNINDSVEIHNRANQNKETIINKLNDEIVNLKDQLLVKDREHKQCTEDLKIANSKKMRNIATECADALLKADRKNTKAIEKAQKINENKPTVNVEETEKKQKARTGTKMFTVEQIKNIKERRAAGEKVIDIAKDLKVHKSTINRALKK